MEEKLKRLSELEKKYKNTEDKLKDDMYKQLNAIQAQIQTLKDELEEDFNNATPADSAYRLIFRQR